MLTVRDEVELGKEIQKEEPVSQKKSQENMGS